MEIVGEPGGVWAMVSEECGRFLLARLREEPRATVARLRDLADRELGVRVGEGELRRWLRDGGWVGIPRVLRGLPRGEVLDAVGDPRAPLDAMEIRVLMLRVGLGEKPATQGEAAERLGIGVDALRRIEAKAADKVRRVVLGLGPERAPERKPKRAPRVRAPRVRGRGWSTRFRGLAAEVGSEALDREIREMEDSGEIAPFDVHVVRARLGLDGRAVPTKYLLAQRLGVSSHTVQIAEERTAAKVRRRMNLGEVRMSGVEGHRRARRRLRGGLQRDGVRAVVEACEQTLADVGGTLEGAFGAAGLSKRQRETLLGYLGLDGRGPRTEPQMAREMGISSSQVHRHRKGALRRLILHVLLGGEPAEERRRAAREPVDGLVELLHVRAAAEVRDRLGVGRPGAVADAAVLLEGAATGSVRREAERRKSGRAGVGIVNELVGCSAGVLDREGRRILRGRFGCGGEFLSLAALAAEFRLSKQGVRLAEMRAAGKLLRVLKMAQDPSGDPSGDSPGDPSEAGHEARVDVQG